MTNEISGYYEKRKYDANIMTTLVGQTKKFIGSLVLLVHEKEKK